MEKSESFSPQTSNLKISERAKKNPLLANNLAFKSWLNEIGIQISKYRKNLNLQLIFNN